MQLESIVIVIHVLAAIAITGLVLIQRGKGADIGASFGAGASQTMFGTLGSGNLLTRSTTVLTVVFFATSLGLAVVASDRAEQALQADPLISGDIEQINSELRSQAPANSDVPAPAAQAPAGDLPAAAEDAPAADLPEAPATEGVAEGETAEVSEPEAAEEAPATPE